MHLVGVWNLVTFLGEHYIDVRLYNQSVQDGPFSCNVGDPELVTVRNMPSHLKHTDLGEPQTFESERSFRKFVRRIEV